MFSQQWCDEVLRIANEMRFPRRLGASTRLRLEIPHAHHSVLAPVPQERTFYVAIRHGRLHDVQYAGTAETQTLARLSWLDAVAHFKGTLTPTEAYLAGRLFYDGSMTSAFRIAPIFESERYYALLEALEEITDLSVDHG